MCYIYQDGGDSSVEELKTTLGFSESAPPNLIRKYSYFYQILRFIKMISNAMILLNI